jgi:acyl carrier protein
MISLEDYLAELAERDIKLWLDDGKLRVNAPQGALSPELQSELTARKQELVDFLSKGTAGSNRLVIKPFPRDQRIPLTHGQERIWSLSKMATGSSVYNVPTVFHLKGALDVRALERSLNEIQQRHEILHTIFPGADVSAARQEILPESKFVLLVTPIERDKKLTPEQAQREIGRLLQREARRPFDLSRGPLWRARLFRLAPQRHVLSVTMHHIIFDGVSKAIFTDELARYYKTFMVGSKINGEPASIQYADFAAWQREVIDEKMLERQLAYWQSRLAGAVPELVTPNDRPRLSGKRRAGSLHFDFPAAMMEKVAELGRLEQASAFVTLITVFMVLLNRFTVQEDLVVCSPTASRNHADLEHLIGYFNNIVVLRGDLTGNPPFRALLARMRRLTIEAYDNQNTPLQHLAQLPNLVRTPLTRAMFSYQDVSSRRLDLAGIEAAPINVRKDAADFDLAMYVESDGGILCGVLDYNADIFAHQTIARFLKGFGRVLALAAKNPERKLEEFPRFGPGKKVSDIEKILTRHSQIDQAVVVPEPRTGKLIAYLVLNEHDVPSLETVRGHASASLPDYLVPVSFIPVDEMPLRPDGSIDKAALPPPSVDRDRIGASYVAPTTELERGLAEIWKKVLWLDHDVGINDRWRDLGGHSLLSVQLVTEIEKTLQRRVPAKALSGLNTIAELAAAFEENEKAGGSSNDGVAEELRSGLPQDIYRGLRTHTASWEGKRTRPESVMVGLNTGGARQALFWCLQRYQELTQLAKYLGSDQPVYGMRSGNRVMVKNQDNIERLAAHYVTEILEVQPEGPYLIGGNCQAAQIAFEIAAQLTAIGHEITLLMLHEKFIPKPYGGPVALTFGADSTYNPHLYFHEPALGWRKYYTSSLDMKLVSGAHGQFFREPNIQILVATIKKNVEEAQARDFSSWTENSRKQESQVLPEDAYRARLAATAEHHSAPGEAFIVPVEITNLSTYTWQPTAVSGIALANRWLDDSGKVRKHLDGRALLLEALEPGASITLELAARAPAEPGRWTMELDLVDEGVIWFREHGATPSRVSVTVREARGEINLLEKIQT